MDLDFDIPDIIWQRAANIIGILLPQRSANRYNVTYDAFRKWQADNHVPFFRESVLLVYTSMKPSIFTETYILKKIQVFQNVSFHKNTSFHGGKRSILRIPFQLIFSFRKS